MPYVLAILKLWLPNAMYSGDDMFEQNVFNALNSLYKNIQETGAGNVKTKEAKGNVILDFAFSKDKDVEIIESDGYSKANEKGYLIEWNSQENILLVKDREVPRNKGLVSSTSSLAHEFGHAWLAQFSPLLNEGFEYADRKDDKDPNEHKWILNFVENKFAASRGEGIRRVYRKTFNGLEMYKENKNKIYPELGDIRILTPYKP